MENSGTDAIVGLAGVLIWTDNFKPMAAFYRDTLGLTPRSLKPGFINFQWGEVKLTVSVHDAVHGSSADPLRLMINLLVGNIFAVHARLTSAGVTFGRPPEREAWGGYVATFADPDGNTLQLLQPAEQSG
jgi:catechol 2,3-dioxygenase-like lactoylglutathione lyase family enzyme